jgi:hypothetical protein
VVVVDGTTLVLVGADGVAGRREMAGFGAHPSAGNRGKILTRIGNLAAVAPVNQDTTLWCLTSSGEMKAVAAAQVPSGPGASSGKQMMRLGEERLVALTVT